MISYEEMLRQLLGAARFGLRPGLERMRAALAEVEAPQRRLGRIVLIGGTNGKGSTAAMLAAMLSRSGRRTGLYTSPHLARFTERIRIDGREVEREALARRYDRLARVMPRDLTFFEQATALGLMTFADEGVEATVLEVGMGGGLDATNVVDPDVAVVTGVALDHEDVLGRDVATIAREKAGIFRPGRPAIIGAGGEPTALPVLDAEARARGAERLGVGCELPPGWTVGLPGAHQRCNAACALAAARLLDVPAEACRAGLAEARWPGRLERSGGLLLDAAHNPHGAQALARYLETETQPFVVLAAVSADKDARGVLAPVLARARAAVVTEAPSPRALSARSLAAVAPGAVVIGDWREALARARSEAARIDGLVVVFGSLFLVGAVRALVRGEETDPVSTADPAAGNLPRGTGGA